MQNQISVGILSNSAHVWDPKDVYNKNIWLKNSSTYSKMRDKSQQNSTSSMLVKDTTKLFTYWL
jgi:hypothetical protein